MSIRRGFVVLFLFFVTLGIYYPSIFSGASSIDDPQMITAYFNAEHLDLKSLFLPGGSGYYYRPLLALTFYLDSFFWGMRESFMHLENIIFHAVNVILVYFITIKIANRYIVENKTLPLCAALIFAVHPVNTESVNWISGRTDLIACIFTLLAILLLFSALQRENILFGLAASVAFLLSCFAKEVAVCALPGFIFLVVCFDQQGTILERIQIRWRYSVLLTASAVTYFLFRFYAFNRGDSGMKLASDTVKLPASNPFDAIRIILKVLGFYTKKLFVPWPLNFAIVRISDYYVIIGVLLIIGLVYILYKRSVISALFLTSICIMTPALLAAFGRMTWTPLAERYLYIPSAPFCIAISLLLSIYLNRAKVASRTVLLIFVPVVLAGSVYTTVNRNITWQSNVALFQDTLRNSPDFFLAQNALASALEQEGRKAEAKSVLLSMVAPEGNKRAGKLVDSNRAKMMATDGDLSGARKLLLRNLDDSGVLYTNIAEQIIGIDMTLLNKETDVHKKNELRREIVTFLVKLQEKSGDPLYFYRIGQFYLRINDKQEAQHYFSLAFQYSKDGAYYKAAAKKLSEKLKQ
jgi:tetratricopeptide (TPR) repeat protein